MPKFEVSCILVSEDPTPVKETPYCCIYMLNKRSDIDKKLFVYVGDKVKVETGS